MAYLATILSNGSVWVESMGWSVISTWCFNANRNWPYDIVDCDIQIQLNNVEDDVTLAPLEEESFIVPKVSQFHSNYSNAWFNELNYCCFVLYFIEKKTRTEFGNI